MDDMDLAESTRRDDVGASTAAGPITAAAFVLPWALLAFALPGEWRWKALALLALLTLLLCLAALVGERMARARGLDAAWWGFLCVVTVGFALLAIYAWPAGAGRSNPQFVCKPCGRLGDAREPFCYGCGSFG